MDEVQENSANVSFTIYYMDTGKIYMSGNVPENDVGLQTVPSGCAMILEASDPSTDYVVGGHVTARPENPATLSGYVISGIPVPSQILVEGVWYDCPDPECELDYPKPGTYTVVVRVWPYMDKSFLITKV
jgi:hypothetical protein